MIIRVYEAAGRSTARAELRLQLKVISAEEVKLLGDPIRQG